MPYSGTPEEKRAKWRANYARNHAQKRAYANAYSLRNHERISALRAGYFQRDPERHLAMRHARNARYRAKNLDKLTARERLRRSKNPERTRAQNHKNNMLRRLRKQADPRNDLTPEQWRLIQEAQNHRCVYCDKRCKGRLTQDHITPISQGGSHTLHNVIGACKSCNSSKGTRLAPKLVQPLLL